MNPNLNSVNQVLLQTLLALQQVPVETELLNAPIIETGNNTVQDSEQAINQGALFLKTFAKVTFDLHGGTFLTGDTNACVGFVQSGNLYVANVLLFGGINGQNGQQTVLIPLVFFHQINKATVTLDTTKPVSATHIKSLNSVAFTFEVDSIKITG